MSMPRICKDPHIPCQDTLQHALYSGSAGPLLRHLISVSRCNIARDFPSPGVQEALARFDPPSDAAPGLLRVVLLVLLNVDSRLRRSLCEQRFVPHIPPLCPHKACRFYDLLKDEVLHEWVRNENISTAELVEQLKEAYLVA